jgi:ubiquinone/menaquinone biosynthesis C-methylase UbiE
MEGAMQSEPEVFPRQTQVDQVLDLLDGYVAASALSAAFEFGLFWLLEAGPMTAEDIAKRLDLPLGRCSYWLQYLSKLDFLSRDLGGYALTGKTRSAVIDAYSRESWRLLAQEAHEGIPPFQFFTSHLATPGSLWQVAGLEPPNYFAQMAEDLERARRFTRMLFELHQDLAAEIAKRLDLSNVNRLMDLGGGSGVVSMSLLAEYPQLEVVVIDIPSVCKAGSEIVNEIGLADRIGFHPADFTQDDLPGGFEMILECDVGIYSQVLFEKVRRSLEPGGRYVILDQFAPAPGLAPGSRLTWAVQGSLRDPAYKFREVDDIVTLLETCGYQEVTAHAFPIPSSNASRFTGDFFRIEARV